MVQKEIKNKARIYGVVGILSAIVLVAMIYSYGAAPQILNPNPTPSAMPSVPPDTLPTVTPLNPETLPVNNPEAAPITNFLSYEELNNFVNSNNNRGSANTLTPPMPLPSAATVAEGVTGAVSPTQDSSKSLGSYSTTNIQVAGVDEADTVKTDGSYLYTIVNGTVVYILNAGATNPQNANVLSKIAYNNGYISGIYLSQDGSKLAVIGSRYIYYTYPVEDKASPTSSLIAPPYWSSGTSFIEVYDVTNKAAPALARNFTMSGNYFNSRMIGDFVYAIITETVYNSGNGTVNLPVVYAEKGVYNIEPTSISYIRTPDSSYTYTSVISINILNSAQAPTNTTVMMGYTNEMYVSANNIYVISPTYTEQGQFSSIYKIGINQAVLTAQAKGSVIGTPINQYAMDEYEGYFRIATTTWIQDNATTTDGAIFKVTRQVNSIYVLDSNLKIVGKLEGFKMDENLYSVRFLGEKCYAVTFKRIDPFFVIDMSNPTSPKVAGELKIPGYSSYLYPIDENHIIGIGKENSTLKLSLFDVTNADAPTETAKYIVESSYSDSQALYDPHAVVYNAEKQLLIIPVSVNDMGVMPFIDSKGGRDIATSSSSSYWQGVYVFKIDTTNGITLQGKVTQIDYTQTQNSDYYWMSSNLYINRALYIDNTLYTISNGRVQLNNLNDFSLLAKVNLN